MARSFSVDMRRFIERAGSNGGLVVRKVVLDLGTGIVMKTPVGDPTTWAPSTRVPPGYVGGRARGSWQYAKGTHATGQTGIIDPSGGQSIGRITAGALQGDPFDVHYITTNLPYMRRLEYDGWSRQAPEGMVRKTISEFQAHIERAVRGLP